MSKKVYTSILEIFPGDDYYNLLGCDELSTTEQINTEFRHKIRKIHPDKNSGDEETKLFKKLKKARDTLIDEEKRKSYDKWRQMGISVPYETWLELSRAAHTSMHWAAKPRQEPMLEYEKTGECSYNDSSWKISSTLKSPVEGSDSDAGIKIVNYVKSKKPYARFGWKSNYSKMSDKFRRYEI